MIIDQLQVTEHQKIDFDGDGELGKSDADDDQFYVHLWWAFRQIQDPGNMMSSLDHVAVVVVSVALTVFGLFLVSFLIGLGTDVGRELMELSQHSPGDPWGPLRGRGPQPRPA